MECRFPTLAVGRLILASLTVSSWKYGYWVYAFFHVLAVLDSDMLVFMEGSVYFLSCSGWSWFLLKIWLSGLGCSDSCFDEIYLYLRRVNE
jgi:hypothetical protein